MMEKLKMGRCTLSILLMIIPYSVQADARNHQWEGHSHHQYYDDRPHKHKYKEHRKHPNAPRYYPNYGMIIPSPAIPVLSVNLNVASIRPIAIDYGITGYSRLPPKMARQIIVGQPLPAGIGRHHLPRGFVSQLPVYEGYEWRISGRDLLLVAVSTAVVVKVIQDVFE
ncbi:anti-virulence regulator CigR family protein [Providencia vermicola]|uniref:Anti-virulence regulator CigR family protein n=2 Tax=Providencia vermicola TaxID=333965 RepID=A0AAX3S215_9GAMM|nr:MULTISPECIES: anti-virulence regulator CigR family protein [Providencia]USB35829.1 anti-virulence regulator CigR family protein [Providencia vermicola]WFC08336.1 anti-virulence regulator CigR family protein [Providencia vermicola]